MTENDAPDPLEPLAQRAGRGDRSALEQLLLELQPALFRAAGSVMGAGHPCLEDVVQESMLRLVRALPTFRRECSVRSYGLNIAVRSAIDWRRKEKARPDIGQRVHDPASELEGRDDRTPEQGALLRNATGRLLAVLTPIQAEALVLRTVFGLSYEELGRTLEVPTETARSRVKLARRALDAAFEANPNLADETRWGRLG